MELSEIWGNEAKPTEFVGLPNFQPPPNHTVAAGQPQQTRVWSSREARWILGATHVDCDLLDIGLSEKPNLNREVMIIIHWSWGFPLNFQTHIVE
jgi:hypothetical protein